MNICFLNQGFQFYGVKGIEFISRNTILDFDAVFINLKGLAKTQQHEGAAVEFRRSEFSEFLALGRTIVVFTAPVLNLDLVLPIQSVFLKELSGNNVDFKGPDHLRMFWQSVQRDMQFLAHFQSAPGVPFLFVSKTDKAVGTLVKYERGNLLLLPWFTPNPNPRTHAENCQRFIEAFAKLNEHLAPQKPLVSLPAWSTHYGWERERELRMSLTSLQMQADKIAEQLGIKAVELEGENSLKILFTAKGDVLVDAVITVLRELGVRADLGEPGRADVVVEFEGKHAVVEVKGKKGSAAESDAAQLEKWVAGFKEEKGQDAKGILLVNDYSETPLADRTLPAFPHQMLKYSTQREHCLMSTTQLFGLLLEARAHPDRRTDLVNSLFLTVGVYQQFTDWQKFLVATASEPVKQG